MTCTGGLCHNGIHTHVHVHTCKRGPTRYHLTYGKQSPNGQDLGEGPRSRNVPPPGPHPHQERLRKHSQSCWPSGPGSGLARGRKKTGCSTGRQGRPSGGSSGPPRPREKVLGLFVCCPEQKSVFTAQPLKAWDRKTPCGHNWPESPWGHRVARSGNAISDLVPSLELPKPGHYIGQVASFLRVSPSRQPRPPPTCRAQGPPEGDPGWSLAPVLSQANSLSPAGKRDSTISVSPVTGPQPGKDEGTLYFGEGTGAYRNLVHADPLGRGPAGLAKDPGC